MSADESFKLSHSSRLDCNSHAWTHSYSDQLWCALIDLRELTEAIKRVNSHQNNLVFSWLYPNVRADITDDTFFILTCFIIKK